MGQATHREDRSTDRAFGLASAVIAGAVLGYFAVLDRSALSTRGFSAIFAGLLKGDDERAAWLSAALVLLAVAWRTNLQVLRLVDAVAARPATVAAVFAAVAAALAKTVYHAYPLSMDEYAAVFQAQLFAGGRIEGRWPATLVDWLVVPGFNGPFLVASHETGRVIGAYWPGFSALLAPFVALSVPWLANPLIGAVALWLVFSLGERLAGDRRAGAWALLLAGSSSVFWADSISFYSMQAHLACNLAFTWLLLRGSTRAAFGAGLVGALALNLHNPVPHALYALPWIVGFLGTAGPRRIVALAAGYVPGVGVLLAWWWLRTNVADSGLAHGMAVNVAAAFAWPDAVTLNMRLAGLVKLWVWAAPGLPAMAVWGGWRSRGDPRVRALAASAVLTLVGYAFVRFDQGHGWGYRYFHPAWAVMPILAGGALSTCDSHTAGVQRFAAVAMVGGLLALVPLQMLQIGRVITGHLALLPAPLRPGNDVYFIRPVNYRYIADAVHVDPWLRSADLHLSSRGARLDEELVRQNWPGAVRQPGAPFVDHWYLGAQDRRVGAGDGGRGVRFLLRYDSPTPASEEPHAAAPRQP